MAVSSRRDRERAKQGNDFGVLRIPQGRDFFKFEKAGLFQMIIVPYVVPQGAKHPVAQPGEMHYSREYHVHRNFGPSGQDFAICPRLTVGGRCPICEGVRELIAEEKLTKEDAKKYRPSKRAIYNVYFPDKKEMVLFDTSDFGFTETLNNAVDTAMMIPGNEWADLFADPKEGSILYVSVAETPGPKGNWYKATTIQFRQHGGIDQEILNMAVPLDDSLIIDSYDALKARFWGEEIPEPAPVEEPPATKTQVSVPASVPAPEQTRACQPAEQPKAGAFTKGQTLYHKEFGKVSYLKSADGVSVTVLDGNDDALKVKMVDLSADPWPDLSTSKSPVSPEPVTVSASASSDDPEAWDAGWQD